MGLATKFKTWVAKEILTYSDLNSTIDGIINHINDIDNSKFSSDAADRLVSTKVSHQSIALNTYLDAEHSATGTHTAIASNNADDCRVTAGTTATSQIDVDADQMNLYDSDTVASRVRMLVQSVNVTVDITASGANGLDTGSEAGSTWYYIWVIAKAAGTIAGLLSTSYTITSLTLPTDYVYALCVGKVYNDAGSDFLFPIPRAGMGANEFEPVLSAAESITDPGYLKMGNGLIFQWGQISCTGGGVQTLDTFALAFPTACLICVVCGADDDAISQEISWDKDSTTTTQISIHNQNNNTTEASWIAIGN